MSQCDPVGGFLHQLSICLVKHWVLDKHDMLNLAFDLQNHLFIDICFLCSAISNMSHNQFALLGCYNRLQAIPYFVQSKTHTGGRKI